MSKLLKITGLIFLLLVYIGLIGLVYANHIIVHIILSVIILPILISRFTLNKVINEIKLILPFLGLMLVTYILMGVLGIKTTGAESGRERIMAYWLHYGGCRIILFINTLLYVQLIISYIRIEDIISLPYSMKYKKGIILGKALFRQAIEYVGELEFHLKLLPEYQIKHLSLSQWFKFKLQLTFAVIIMLLRESKTKGELIDNRIKHCFPSK